jgi:hypothetical protein
MTIYKTRVFDRWAKEQDLDTSSLCQAVYEMQNGSYEANLGSGLFKKRIARQGHGKRSGFRTLIATNQGDRWFFIFGFAKNVRSNIDQREERALKELAKRLLNYTSSDLSKAQRANEIIEVICDEKNKISDIRSRT